MGTAAFIDLAFNFGILAICSVSVMLAADLQINAKISSKWNIEDAPTYWLSVLLGLVFGITCLILIMSAYHGRTGNVIDTRAAPAILSGMIGGPIAGAITFIIGGFARYVVGGDFVIGGVTSIGVYVLFGLVVKEFSKFDWEHRQALQAQYILFIGVGSVIIIFPCFFLDQDIETSWKAALATTQVLMINNSVGLLILGGVLRKVLDNISNRKALEIASKVIKQETETINHERNRMLNAIESLPEAFVLYDADDRLVMCNSRYKRLYYKSADSMVQGATFESIIQFGIENGQYPDATGREEAFLEERMKRHRNPSGPMEQRLPGNRFLQIHEVKTDLGETVGFRVDVTKLRRQQQSLENQTRKLKRQAEQLELQSVELKSQAASLKRAKNVADTMAVTDALTGLGNRRGLDLHLKKLSKELTSDAELFLLHIDLDRFKAINDAYGHAVGDQVLIFVAQILNSSTRRNEYVARLGGDEFAIAAIERNGKHSGEAISRRIIDACKQPYTLDGRDIKYGASIGIAVSIENSSTGLMENADLALYAAKNKGRNQFVHFRDELKVNALKRRQLESDLIEAFLQDQFVPYFQPQIRADENTVVGVEALIRWQHPVKGLIAPSEFLSTVEDLGRLADIDYLMLQKSLEAADRIQKHGVNLAKVSVNLSYMGLTNPKLMEFLDNLQLMPCRLAFELLETIDFDRAGNDIFDTFEKLKKHQVEIELDDFGSGHASITTLLVVRPDRIKIDRQLTSDIGSGSSEKLLLATAIAEIGKGLGIGLTAEGVETEAQSMALRKLGFDILQGFYFAKPMSEEDLIYWLRNR